MMPYQEACEFAEASTREIVKITKKNVQRATGRAVHVIVMISIEPPEKEDRAEMCVAGTMSRAELHDAMREMVSTEPRVLWEGPET